MKSQTVFFIIDGKKLEAQACCLVATLRRFLGWDISVIAYVRQDGNELEQFTLRLLEAARVEFRYVPMSESVEDDPWTIAYPIGNKILAASDKRDTELGIFLDTDTILVKPVDFEAILEGRKIAAVISDYTGDGLDEGAWEQFYKMYDLQLTEERLNLLRGRQILSPPYFNAGVIIFIERFDGVSFGQEWLKDAVKFDHEVTLPHNRINIDQITFPITAYRLGHPVKPISFQYNYNLVGNGFVAEAQQNIVHFHKFKHLWSCPHGPLVLDCMRELLPDTKLTEYKDTFTPIIKPRIMRNIL